MWDFLDLLAYLSLLIAVGYIAFVCWSVLRGRLDHHDDDPRG